MGAVITQVNISKNPVGTSERFTVSVTVKEAVKEPAVYRLPYTLGEKKGGIR